MNRLQAEWHRLYLPLHAPPPGDAAPADAFTALAGSDGRVRALVLAIAGPAAWDAVLAVWQGVQADLQLPAPAIAVAGSVGYQLWFSLAEPVAVATASAFLHGLRRRYLPEAVPESVSSFPGDHAGAPPASPPRLPPGPLAPGRWAAFVAPDLGALFAEEPWLDLPPSADAQADLLSRVQVAPAAEWRRACERLAPAASAAAPPVERAAVFSSAPTHDDDPRRFLLAIMNDSAIDLHLRIEAAKALLPYCPATSGT